MWSYKEDTFTGMSCKIRLWQKQASMMYVFSQIARLSLVLFYIYTFPFLAFLFFFISPAHNGNKY